MEPNRGRTEGYIDYLVKAAKESLSDSELHNLSMQMHACMNSPYVHLKSNGDYVSSIPGLTITADTRIGRLDTSQDDSGCVCNATYPVKKTALHNQAFTRSEYELCTGEEIKTGDWVIITDKFGKPDQFYDGYVFYAKRCGTICKLYPSESKLSQDGEKCRIIVGVGTLRKVILK